MFNVNDMQDYTIATEADIALHGVFEVAMEGQAIPTAIRNALDDEYFGIVYKDDNGKPMRKYPLFVPNDPEATKELQRRAIGFFHFCRPDWKKELAKKIVDMIIETESGVKIGSKSQINKYVDVPDSIKGEEVKYTKNKK